MATDTSAVESTTAPTVVGMPIGGALTLLVRSGVSATIVETGTPASLVKVVGQSATDAAKGAGPASVTLVVTSFTESDDQPDPAMAANHRHERLFAVVLMSSPNEGLLASDRAAVQRYMQAPFAAVSVEPVDRFSGTLPGPYALVALFQNETIARRAATDMRHLGFDAVVIAATRSSIEPIEVNIDEPDI